MLARLFVIQVLVFAPLAPVLPLFAPLPEYMAIRKSLGHPRHTCLPNAVLPQAHVEGGAPLLPDHALPGLRVRPGLSAHAPDAEVMELGIMDYPNGLQNTWDLAIWQERAGGVLRNH